MTPENEYLEAFTEGEREVVQRLQYNVTYNWNPIDKNHAVEELSIIKRLGGEVVRLRDEAGYNPDGSDRTDQDYADLFGQTLEEYQAEAKATAERFKKKLPLMIELAEKNRRVKELTEIIEADPMKCDYANYEKSLQLKNERISHLEKVSLNSAGIIKELEASLAGSRNNVQTALNQIQEFEAENAELKEACADYKEMSDNNWKVKEEYKKINAEFMVEISKLNHTIGRLSLLVENKTKLNEGG